MTGAAPHLLPVLKEVVQAMTRLCEGAPGEATLVAQGSGLMRRLIERDDWLPPEYAEPDATFYRQYLLHADPLERFSLVSFVWGPGQKTPVHDHTVWGIIGMLRGAETSQRFHRSADGTLLPGALRRLEPGDVEVVSPTLGDIHLVRNAYDDRVSISLHMYGGNIGAIERHVFDPSSGQAKSFVSGYSNAALPNIWGATGSPAR